MDIMRKVVPGIAVVGISLVLAVGVGRVLRQGAETESNLAIAITVAATPGMTAKSAELSYPGTVDVTPPQTSLSALDAGTLGSHSGCETSVCRSTVTGAPAGDAQRVPRNAIVIDDSSGQLDPAFVVDAVSSASPLLGNVGMALQSIPEML